MATHQVTVERRDALHLRISRVLREESSHRLDVYLFVPAELGLNAHVLSEEAFYHGAIHVKRTYYSDRHRLPLVMSRLAGKRLDADQYRLGLSLYAYQYVVALERSTQSLLDQARRARKAEKRAGEAGEPAEESRAGAAEEGAAESGRLRDQLEETLELSRGILRRLRRQEPSDESLHRYYANIDNYLSWFTEQRLLELIAHLPRGSDYRETRKRLLDVCCGEDAHRRSREYNAERVTRDPTRMSNKMRLLRRLIEYPVTLKQRSQELGGGEEKAVKALATAVVMVFVTLGLLEARAALGDITALFVLVLAVIYALREVFKDDLRMTLWRLLRRGRPKWRRQYLDAHSNAVLGRQLEWFDYQRYGRLDEEIRRVRKRNMAQREEVVMHYRSSSRMSPTRFLSGYDRTRETLTLDLSPLARLMSKGNHHVYRLEEKGQVVREAVEKRHLINLVIREVEGGGTPMLQRWKIVMSRSKIVDVELVHEEGPEDTADPAKTERAGPQ